MSHQIVSFAVTLAFLVANFSLTKIIRGHKSWQLYFSSRTGENTENLRYAFEKVWYALAYDTTVSHITYTYQCM